MNIVFESYSDKLITKMEDINNWIKKKGRNLIILLLFFKILSIKNILI